MNRWEYEFGTIERTVQTLYWEDPTNEGSGPWCQYCPHWGEKPRKNAINYYPEGPTHCKKAKWQEAHHYTDEKFCYDGVRSYLNQEIAKPC